jgi:hypothetical protein
VGGAGEARDGGVCGTAGEPAVAGKETVGLDAVGEVEAGAAAAKQGAAVDARDPAVGRFTAAARGGLGKRPTRGSIGLGFRSGSWSKE